MKQAPISVAQARAIDREAVERFGMPSILLMENAARALADLIRSLGTRARILCGPGNNGGDGLAAARHFGPGARVHLLARPDAERSPDAFLQHEILRRADWDLPVGEVLPEPTAGEVWVDALFGTGLARPLEGRAADWVAQFNRAPGPRVCVDIPSGLNGDTGAVLGIACRGTHTLTFAAPKHGLCAAQAAEHVGILAVAPLGIPAAQSG